MNIKGGDAGGVEGDTGAYAKRVGGEAGKVVLVGDVIDGPGRLLEATIDMGFSE